MKRTTISLDSELMAWCENRAAEHGLKLSQFFRILAHNERAKRQTGVNIVAEQQNVYGTNIINHTHKAKKSRNP